MFQNQNPYKSCKKFKFKRKDAFLLSLLALEVKFCLIQGKCRLDMLIFFEKPSLAMLNFSQIQLSHAQSMLIFLKIQLSHAYKPHAYKTKNIKISDQIKRIFTYFLKAIFIRGPKTGQLGIIRFKIKRLNFNIQKKWQR